MRPTEKMASKFEFTNKHCSNDNLFDILFGNHHFSIWMKIIGKVLNIKREKELSKKNAYIETGLIILTPDSNTTNSVVTNKRENKT